MNGSQSLTASLLASAGVFTDERIQEIVTKRAENPGMGLTEAVVKFGGVKEGVFLAALGKHSRPFRRVPFINITFYLIILIRRP